MWSIVHKEYRQRARGVATLGLILTYTLILGAVAFFVYLTSYTALAASTTTSGDVGRAMGIALFITQMIMALLLSLSLNASTIASEKDQETFDLLNLTLFKSWEIVLGKYASSTGFLFILVVTAFPAYALAFTFGGMRLEEFLSLAVVVIGMTLFISSIGLLLSLVSEDVRTALSRSFLALFAIGMVTAITGGILVSSFNTAPPSLPLYWLGTLSILLNPLWAAWDIFSPLTLSWPTPQPLAVPFIIQKHILWLASPCLQLVCTLLLLLLTTAIYPRYRAIRKGGAA